MTRAGRLACPLRPHPGQDAVFSPRMEVPDVQRTVVDQAGIEPAFPSPARRVLSR